MMMFNLYVQQNKWIVVALLGGSTLVILFWLFYLAMWRPRQAEARVEPHIAIRGPVSFFRWVRTFTPWALLLIIIATTLYTVTHLLAAARELPNW